MKRHLMRRWGIFFMEPGAMRATHQRTLEDEVFVLFSRACGEEEFGLAEHLLRAIEFMAARRGRPEQIERAYWCLAESCGRGSNSTVESPGHPTP